MSAIDSGASSGSYGLNSLYNSEITRENQANNVASQTDPALLGVGTNPGQVDSGAHNYQESVQAMLLSVKKV